VHDGPLNVPEGHERVTVDDENAGPYGWRVMAADVADPRSDWPAHDPIRLGRVLEELARRR
jgi:hypothetical protein